MVASLPPDLLLMICDSLEEAKDIDTLYQCALAGKQLTVRALSGIYRLSHEAPVVGGGGDEVEQSNQEEKTSIRDIRARQECILKKWANMWRSIILSSLGKTLYPYSQYIRTLHLADLENLITDGKFLQISQINKAFFEGDLEISRVDRSINGSHKKKNYLILDAQATVSNLADVILQHTPMLEELSGPEQSYDANSLARAIPRLCNLRLLKIFYGQTLEGAGSLLEQHCPLLHTLSLFGWSHPQADEQCATLLRQLRPQSLRTLKMQSAGNCGAESFLALNNHRESLRKLKLDSIDPEAMPAISALKGCTNLTSLSLSEKAPPSQDLEKRHNDIFLEVVAWLRDCKHLRKLKIRNFICGPALLTPLLLEKDIKLLELSLEDYPMAESKEFHQALAHQPSLKKLLLSGEGVDPGHVDNDVLVEALSKLENLEDLQLKDVSDGFLNTHIEQVVRDLPMLENLGISGFGVNDEIWPDLASLKSLKVLEINALSRFTANGIITFVSNLGAGNRELALSINMQENDCEVSEEDQAMIRETLDAKVAGRFGLTLWKDPDADDYSVQSD